MKRHITKKRVATVIAILLLLLWWWWPGDPLTKVHELQGELFGSPQAMTPQDRQAKFAELRSEMAKLSPAQRSTLAAERQKRMRERMKHYFEMTQEEKQAYLDQQIDQSQQFQAQAPNGGNGPRGASMSADERERRRQQRLDDTTPEFRAQMDQFRRDMADRRQARGLPPGRG